MTTDGHGFLERLGGTRDPYAAQDLLRDEIARRGAEPVAREVLATLLDAQTPAALRASALGIVFSLADEVADGLAADLLVHLGPSEAESPESALAALARGIARCPEHTGLLAAVRAAARRSRNAEYDARHGRDWLARCVANGTLDRTWLARYNEAIAAPARPSDTLWQRLTTTWGDDEIAALLEEVGTEGVGQVIVERAGDLRGNEPEATRLCLILEALRPRLAPGQLRGRLEAIHAQLGALDFQLSFPCAIRALAELPDERSLDELIESGWEGASDVFTLEEVEAMMEEHGVAPEVRSRVRAAIGRAGG